MLKTEEILEIISPFFINIKKHLRSLTLLKKKKKQEGEMAQTMYAHMNK
jgi:hypothetical protein